jgi:hypothetical protein
MSGYDGKGTGRDFDWTVMDCNGMVEILSRCAVVDCGLE